MVLKHWFDHNTRKDVKLRRELWMRFIKMIPGLWDFGCVDRLDKFVLGSTGDNVEIYIKNMLVVDNVDGEVPVPIGRGWAIERTMKVNGKEP